MQSNQEDLQSLSVAEETQHPEPLAARERELFDEGSDGEGGTPAGP